MFHASLQAFANGFPLALLHAAATLILLVAGIVVHAWLTPYKDVEEIRRGNAAAAISLGGAMLALALPLAMSMAASASIIEILIWGLAVLVAQLLVSRLVDLVLKGLPERIEEGEIAAAALLVAAKLAVAIVLAAAVAA